MPRELTIRQVESDEDLAAARELLLEYGRTPGWAACFQSYAKELAELPGPCRPPAGRLLLARVDGAPAGVVALQPIGEGVAELRRLYVVPAQRGLRVGRALVERLIEEARASGHARLVLHTLPSMQAAHALYRAVGFAPAEPYAMACVEGAFFLGLELAPARA
ncbi:MAG: GNAT family N-acetyltransferase [Planctomycetes bacterium]|nr:GNAT family N-acetyltransferase [Planctomycetota bacterium]